MRTGSNGAGNAGQSSPKIKVKAKHRKGILAGAAETGMGILLLTLAVAAGYGAGLRTGRAEGRVLEHMKARPGAGEMAPANEAVQTW